VLHSEGGGKGRTEVLQKLSSLGDWEEKSEVIRDYTFLAARESPSESLKKQHTGESPLNAQHLRTRGKLHGMIIFGRGSVKGEVSSKSKGLPPTNTLLPPGSRYERKGEEEKRVR